MGVVDDDGALIGLTAVVDVPDSIEQDYIEEPDSALRDRDAALRDRDLPTPWGEEEFTTLAPETGLQSVLQFAETVRVTVARDIVKSGV